VTHQAWLNTLEEFWMEVGVVGEKVAAKRQTGSRDGGTVVCQAGVQVVHESEDFIVVCWGVSGEQKKRRYTVF
jgi:hypothetical protein